MFLSGVIGRSILRRNLSFPHKVLQCFSLMNIISPIFKKQIHSIVINKNLELISKKKINSKMLNFKILSPPEKPLVVCLSWLLSQRKAVLKYSEIYLDQGFDVLCVSITPRQLLWPKNGSQQVAEDVIKFLNLNNKYSPLLIHGFSVGAYQWSEVLIKLAQDIHIYQPIIDRIVGQVWDSAADITEIPEGIPQAVFPNSKIMQMLLRQYTLSHLWIFYQVATIHYVRGSLMFRDNFVKAPALFFLSKTDPIGAYSSNLRIKEAWEDNGIEVYWKCWDQSPHVAHYKQHPREYRQELQSFLKKLDLYK